MRMTDWLAEHAHTHGKRRRKKPERRSRRFFFFIIIIVAAIGNRKKFSLSPFFFLLPEMFDAPRKWNCRAQSIARLKAELCLELLFNLSRWQTEWRTSPRFRSIGMSKDSSLNGRMCQFFSLSSRTSFTRQYWHIIDCPHCLLNGLSRSNDHYH